jgi:hypothetical protein
MKKLIGLFVMIGFFLCPLLANAGIIGNVNLTLYYSSPTGYAVFPSERGNYYLDYDVSLNSDAVDEAFCVEDMNAPSTTQIYTLLSIDSGLSAFGLDPANYLKAAAIAEYYYTVKRASDTTEAWKAGAQIAVWENIFDSNFDLSSGSFQSGAYNSQAVSLWNAVVTQIPNYSSNWALAVNPTVAAGQKVSVAGFQNYLVHVSPVPEPATMALLGSGLIALGIIGRRKLIKKDK